jgi:arylsulfatase A-like enzyme
MLNKHIVGFIEIKILKYMLQKNKPNVFLISIDTLRADHLGCYGYGRNTSPNIDKFAKEGVLFENAFSQFPQTVPSHASILTGMYPNTHRAKIYYDPYTARMTSAIKLDAKFITLAEILKDNGYATWGFVQHNVGLDSNLGFSQGFDSYYTISGNATKLNHKVYENINKNIKSFFFIHYFDVHSDFEKLPYDAPFPYSKMFTQNYKGNFRGGEEGVWANAYLLKLDIESKNILNAEDIQYIRDLYDQGIAYVDNEIGNLFDFLRREGLFDNSVIILLSDHGEAFREHGLFFHNGLYEETIHIPLIVKFPHSFFRGKRINSLVESIDVLPSVLQLLNIPIPKEIQGNEFLSVIAKNRNGKDYIFCGEDRYGIAIRTKNKKIIYRKGYPIEAYDLNSDPKEQYNLCKTTPKDPEVLKLFYLLDEWNKKTLLAGEAIQNNKVNLDEEQTKTLRSLGYLQ